MIVQSTMGRLPRSVLLLLASLSAAALCLLVVEVQPCIAFLPTRTGPITTTTATTGTANGLFPRRQTAQRILLQATPDSAEAATATTTTTTPGSSQAAYGVTVDLPDTYVKCGKCQSAFALRPEDLGNGKGRRLECSVCDHSWFQSKDRILSIKDDFEIIPMPEEDLQRISQNIEEGKKPSFLGACKLYVGNISFECHEDDIMAIFSDVGEVGEVSLVRDEEGRNRGFGFVTMRTKEDGDKAIEALDGTPVRGRRIAVRASNN